MATITAPAIVTADVSVKSTTGKVHWIIASAAATGGIFEIKDSTDDTGTALITGVVGANTGPHSLNFDPPVEFGTAIFADVGGTNVTLTIGYV